MAALAARNLRHCSALGSESWDVPVSLSRRQSQNLACFQWLKCVGFSLPSAPSHHRSQTLLDGWLVNVCPSPIFGSLFSGWSGLQGLEKLDAWSWWPERLNPQHCHVFFWGKIWGKYGENTWKWSKPWDFNWFICDLGIGNDETLELDWFNHQRWGKELAVMNKHVI